MPSKNAYEIADLTFLSPGEARVYARWDADTPYAAIADDLDITEGTVQTYLYRIQQKLTRAEKTLTLPSRDPETIVEETFLKSKRRGSRGGVKAERRLRTMAEAMVLYHVDGLDMPTIADELAFDENDVDELLGEAEAVRARAERTKTYVTV